MLRMLKSKVKQNATILFQSLSVVVIRKKISEEVRKQMSISRTGRKLKPCSDETKAKISAAASKRNEDKKKLELVHLE